MAGSALSLRLLALRPEHLRAMIDGGEAFERAFGLRLEPGYIEFDGALERSLNGLELEGIDPRWWAHAFVLDDERAVVGLGGFKGPPNGGAVEIGYGIAPAYRGRGLATAAARGLVELAAAGGARLVVAHTLAAPNASTRVLQRCGFVRAGEADDPQVGTIWRWELPLGG